MPIKINDNQFTVDARLSDTMRTRLDTLLETLIRDKFLGEAPAQTETSIEESTLTLEQLERAHQEFYEARIMHLFGVDREKAHALLAARLETFMEFGYTEEQARALRKFVDAINGEARPGRRLLTDLDVVKAFAKWGPHAE